MTPGAARNGSIGRYSMAVLCIGAALVLLYLAVPRSVAAFLALPGNPVMKRAEAGERIDPDRARDLALSRHHALAWADAPAYWNELGFAETVLAYAGAGRDPDRAMLDRAVGSTKSALLRAPTHSEAWLRLAFMRSVASGASPDAGRAYAMALLTGPVKPKQVAYRLDLAFRLWPALTADDRRLVGQYVRSSWRYGYQEIVATANTPLREGILRAAFAAQPETLANFEALLAKRAGQRQR